MGISNCTVKAFTTYKARGFIDDLKNVCEIGSQEVRLGDYFPLFEEFLRALGVEATGDAEWRRICQDGSSRDLFTKLGLEYASIDTDGMFGSLPLDLNYDSVPDEWKGKFDLVTNCGTTEHISNQLNAFKVIHDLTRTGGVMYHEVPFTGWVNHGLFCYTPKYFWMLCRSNMYEYLDLGIHAAMNRQFLHPDILTSVHFEGLTPENFAHQDSAIYCLLRKTDDIEFVPPFDGLLDGADETTTRRYWTFTLPLEAREKKRMELKKNKSG